MNQSIVQPQKTSETYPYEAVHIFYVSVFLTMFGLLIIYASSSIPAAQKFHDPYIFLKKQALMLGAGLAAILVIQKLPIRLFEKLTLPILGLSFFCLICVMIPGLGVKVNGATRWVSFAGFGFQPSEMAKIAIIFFLAKNLSRVHFKSTDFWRGIMPNLFVLAMLCGLVMLQPDLGTSALLCLVTIAMLFVAGMPFKYFGMLAGLGSAALAAAIAVEPYRLKRLISFLDPWANSREGGFQIIQSYLAFHNGGLWGVGLGESKQKLFFLPEAHTDFILPVIGEELGLLGVLFICSMFAYLIFICFRVSMKQQRDYDKLLAVGLTCLITFQALINIGVTMGVLPTKGIPLPFLSSGRSSLIIFLIAIGILIKLARPREIKLVHE